MKGIIPLTLALIALVLTTQISSIEFIKPAIAAELSNVRVLPSTNIVNERANYDFFFTTATTVPIQFIAMLFPNEQGSGLPAFDISAATKVIERSGIGPGFLTTVSGVPGLLVYVVNSPVSIPAGTEIRLDIGAIGNSFTAGSFQVTLATLNANAAIIDVSLAPSFAIKDITGADVSPHFMIEKTLLDDSAGNTRGWNPSSDAGAPTHFTIFDNDVPTGEPVMITINLDAAAGNPICQVNDQISFPLPGFEFDCNVAPIGGAQLNYVIFKLPSHLVTSSLSSSESSSTSPFASSQDTGSINRQDETSSEFP